MDKTAILFSVLLLGWTWTLQGVAADDDQVTTESTVVPADAEGGTVNTVEHSTTLHNVTEHRTTLHNAIEHSTTLHNATEHNTTLHNATDAALINAPFNATEICVKAPETGPCKAYMIRYFSNSTSKSCETFVYGGCGGNRNNFKDEKECMQRCHTEGMAVLDAEEGEEKEEEEEEEEEEEGEEDVCNQTPEAGPCRAYLRRYFYNSTSMRCRKFIYGGCFGNENNFKYKTECMQRCHPEGEEHQTAA